LLIHCSAAEALAIDASVTGSETDLILH